MRLYGSGHTATLLTTPTRRAESSSGQAQTSTNAGSSHALARGAARPNAKHNGNLRHRTPEPATHPEGAWRRQPIHTPYVARLALSRSREGALPPEGSRCASGVVPDSQDGAAASRRGHRGPTHSRRRDRTAHRSAEDRVVLPRGRLAGKQVRSPAHTYPGATRGLRRPESSTAPTCTHPSNGALAQTRLAQVRRKNRLRPWLS